MGYDRERFVGEVDEDLLCSICRDVLEDPVLTPCEHAFCGGCIRRWLEEHRHCPEDRADLDATQLRALFRYMKNQLARLKIRCRNRPHGCEFVGALDSIHRHEEQCDLGLLSWTNSGSEHLFCGLPVSPSSRVDHQNHQHHCEQSERAEPSPSVSALLGGLNAMISRVDDMKFQLDQQRRHALWMECILKSDMDTLQGHICALRSNLQYLLMAEGVRMNCPRVLY